VCPTPLLAGPGRRPAAAALATFHVEQLVLRSRRAGRLATAVVCPGLLYGAGEDDGQLHGLWRAAWEGAQPLALLGGHGGANRWAVLWPAQQFVCACRTVTSHGARALAL
jgi:nucleoside-diphosphate-sugar epimerase